MLGSMQPFPTTKFSMNALLSVTRTGQRRCPQRRPGQDSWICRDQVVGVPPEADAHGHAVNAPSIVRIQQSDRVAFRAGDLFEPWDVEGDAVILARVLHDWDDDLTPRPLHDAHRALRSGGRVFVVEMALPEDGAAGGLCDLHLLAVTGGRERTASEYAALLHRAGFVHDRTRQLPGLPSVVVGTRKSAGLSGALGRILLVGTNSQDRGPPWHRWRCANCGANASRRSSQTLDRE